MAEETDPNKILDMQDNPLDEDTKRAAAAEDLSAVVDAELPALVKMAAGNISEGVEQMMILEKRVRKAGDSASTLRVAQAIIQAAYDGGHWDVLRDSLFLLNKRRGQFKRVISGIVQQAQGFLELIKDQERKRSMIDNLLEMTEGKIFVENERARITQTLARILEAEGKLEEASKLMQELAVETYNTMERHEKTEFILEQMRLCLSVKDNVRAQIISRKISTKLINLPEFAKAKGRFYTLMIQLYSIDGKWLEISRSYLAMYNTPSVQSVEAEWAPLLQNVVLFLLLSPYDSEQRSLCETILNESNLERLPKYQKLLKLFLTEEIMEWPSVEAQYGEMLKKNHPQITEDIWAALQLRIVELNIRIIAKYYSRITMARMAALLNLSPEDTEKNLSRLVVTQSVYARINRPAGIVSFRKKRPAAQVLDDWSSGVEQFMGLLDATTHAIHRELVMHKLIV